MPPGDTATILRFPLADHFTQADIVAVESWARHAERRGWFLRGASTLGGGGVKWIERTSEGFERFTIAYGHPGNGAYYAIIRRGGRWFLENMHAEPLGSFKSIQSALDVICPPAPGAA